MPFNAKLAALGAAASLMLLSCSAEAGPAPTDAQAKAAILHYLNWDTGDANVTFTSFAIGSPHKAGVQEAEEVQVDLGQVVYPIASTYTTISGSGPSAYIRDYVAHYYVYQKENGNWDATTNSTPGDGNHLRGT